MAELSQEQDAFGREIHDYFQGLPDVCEIVERDDGYVDFSSGAPAYFAEYKKWPDYHRQAIKMARGKVLDIGCGAGRCSLHLQQEGHDVVGIDNSPLAVRVCKKRGVKKVYVKSISEIGPDLGLFDTIVMYGNNFGLFGSYKRAKVLLRRMYRMTTDDARIIAESGDPYVTKFPDHLAYHKWNRQRNRMPGQLRIRVRYRKYASPWFDYLLVSRDEMRDILDGTGWKATKFFESPRYAAYTVLIEKE